MYLATQTYWLEPTDQIAWGLRRYTHGSNGFTCETGYHEALVYLGRTEAKFGDEDGRRHLQMFKSGVPHDSDKWPAECKHGCGYRFTEDDQWQDWQELIYRRPDTGQEYVLHQNASADAVGAPSAPPGATWDAWWITYLKDRNPDGIVLMVRCPDGHDWTVDSEANNCTRKGERHQCWVRHGRPQDAQVTVDKNGETCAAGGGSIATPGYHGFLQAGLLTAG